MAHVTARDAVSRAIEAYDQAYERARLDKSRPLGMTPDEKLAFHAWNAGEAVAHAALAILEEDRELIIAYAVAYAWQTSDCDPDERNWQEKRLVHYLFEA